MSNAADQAFPTMIIPHGTEIRINNNGQLSIKTPGNLVIQNSGNYAELESTNGSIRIEENVSVEAVNVRASQACFVLGTLTAWRVAAKKISLENRAKAYIMMQESEQLELSRGARLVGNFANEREIYLMLGKFATQLKELPGSVEMSQSSLQQRPAAGMLRPDLSQPLAEALALLEQETSRGDLDSRAADALREVVFGLRERDLQRVALIYREAFSELTSPSQPLQKAYDLIDRSFSTPNR